MRPPKLVRITTVPLSMRLLLAGQPRYMRSRGMDVVLISSDGPDWEGVPDLAAYEVYKVDMARAISLRRDLLALLKLIRLFRRIRPDIVHSHTPKAGLLAMLAARVAGVPIRMHTVAGLPLMESEGLKRKVLVWVERLTYRCATRVYPNSIRLKTYIEEQDFTQPGKLQVIAGGSSNGIDTEYFKPTEDLRASAQRLRLSWGIPQGDMVYLFVGRIVKDKGVDELVRAFSRLSSRRPGLWLVLVGPSEQDLDPIGDETLRVLQTHPRIRLVGFKADIRPYLCASDILVFPSYREGFPNVPMQAGCFSLPAIVTDINGCNEIVRNEVNGLVVPPKQTEPLERAMERMVVDTGLKERCASASRQSIVERYQQAGIWASLYDEYRRLLLASQEK